MLFYKVAFAVCLLLLFISYAALMAAHKKGDQRQSRVLHFFRLGLSLSAISYLLRITDPQSGHVSLVVFLTCLAGSLFLWLGWIQHWKLHWERKRDVSGKNEAEQRGYDGAMVIRHADGIDTPCLTAHARQALLSAQGEALRRRQCCVDTDHLLVGLLREPRCAGVQILNCLHANPKQVYRDLLGRTAPPSLQMVIEPLALTERARQVIVLAGQEAHRFDRTTIGTEHLLLGLVLVGTGPAAAMLFYEGVTVERIRDEIMRLREDSRL